jgi:hypothetical protein
MSFKTVAIAAAAAVVALTVVDAFIVYRLANPASYAGHTTARAFALGVAAIAAAFAAVRFNGLAEYVGRAWTLLSVLYMLLTISYTLDRLKLADSMATQVMVIVANLAAIGAFWLFGSALRNSGLQFYGSPAVKLAVFAGAVAIACMLVLPTVLDLLGGNLSGIQVVADLVSAAADMLTFILVAPLLLTVWSFRGGKLSWVYGFLALSTVGWMINQAADDLLPRLVVRDTQMFGLFLACASVAAAAYLQHASVRTEAAGV